jgi:hypothetical protein
MGFVENDVGQVLISLKSPDQLFGPFDGGVSGLAAVFIGHSKYFCGF